MRDGADTANDAFDWARDLLVDLIEIPSVSGDEHAITERLEGVARGLRATG